MIKPFKILSLVIGEVGSADMHIRAGEGNQDFGVMCVCVFVCVCVCVCVCVSV